jgi:hypothetical protein
MNICYKMFFCIHKCIIGTKTPLLKGHGEVILAHGHADPPPRHVPEAVLRENGAIVE